MKWPDGPTTHPQVDGSDFTGAISFNFLKLVNFKCIQVEDLDSDVWILTDHIWKLEPWKCWNKFNFSDQKFLIAIFFGVSW